MIVEERIAELVLFLLIITILSIMTPRGKFYTMKKISAIDAIDEVIKRATEMGRPIHFSGGTRGGISMGGASASQSLAGLGCLTFVASLCARLNANLIVTNAIAETYPLQQDIVREAYIKEGEEERYDPSMVQFFSGTEMAYIAAVVGLIQRENIAANIIIGECGPATQFILETASRLGAMQVGGADGTRTVDFICACDYTLLSEEQYALYVYLSDVPELKGVIRGQDICKFIVVGLIMVGAILSVTGSTFLLDLLSM